MKTIVTLSLFLTATVLFSQNTIEKTVGEFSEVKVFDLINVIMIKSDENKVQITGENRHDVEVVNRNGKLKIRMDIEEIYDGSNTDVTLFYTSVDVIDANEGAIIQVKDTMKQYEIELKTQEGAEISATVESSITNLRAVTGGIINIEGTSKQQHISIYTGGILNAEDLVTKAADVRINAGGEAYINATEVVDVKIKAGGDLFIYGNPEEINENRILGGRVKRM